MSSILFGYTPWMEQTERAIVEEFEAAGFILYRVPPRRKARLGASLLFRHEYLEGVVLAFEVAPVHGMAWRNPRVMEQVAAGAYFHVWEPSNALVRANTILKRCLGDQHPAYLRANARVLQFLNQAGTRP